MDNTTTSKSNNSSEKNGKIKTIIAKYKVFSTIEKILINVLILIWLTLLGGIICIGHYGNMNEEYFAKFESRNDIFNNPIDINIPDTIDNVSMRSEDVKKINDHIKFLTGKVEQVVEVSHQTINNDIDRLNNFIALGVGFFGLIGIILPLAFNFFGREDLNKKIEKIETKSEGINEKYEGINEKYEGLKEDLKTTSETAETLKNELPTINSEIDTVKEEQKTITDSIKDALKNANDAKKDSNAAKEITEETQKRMNEISPLVDDLIQRNYISRILNIASVRIDGIDRNSYLSAMFKDINKSFENSNNNKIVPQNNNVLVQNINDFIIGLRQTSFQSNFNSRTGITEITTLISHLNVLLNIADVDQLEEAYNNVIESINRIVQSLN